VVVSGVVIDLGQWEILGAGMDLKESDVLKQWSTSGTVVDLESEWISGAGGGGGTVSDLRDRDGFRGRGGSQGQRWISGAEVDLGHRVGSQFSLQMPMQQSLACELSVMRTR
jgi:hypothetical protein